MIGCPFCDKEVKTLAGLSKHLNAKKYNKKHNITLNGEIYNVRSSKV